MLDVLEKCFPEYHSKEWQDILTQMIPYRAKDLMAVQKMYQKPELSLRFCLKINVKRIYWIIYFIKYLNYF
ncbi:MAG: malate:quinone oxidoreductase [Cytophagaceae bacterium]|nr:malate:quinone oxidoreductase [Cytophagaceae bacterium]